MNDKCPFYFRDISLIFNSSKQRLRSCGRKHGRPADHGQRRSDLHDAAASDANPRSKHRRHPACQHSTSATVRDDAAGRQLERSFTENVSVSQNGEKAVKEDQFWPFTKRL